MILGKIYLDNLFNDLTEFKHQICCVVAAAVIGLINPCPYQLSFISLCLLEKPSSVYHPTYLHVLITLGIVIYLDRRVLLATCPRWALNMTVFGMLILNFYWNVIVRSAGWLSGEREALTASPDALSVISETTWQRERIDPSSCTLTPTQVWWHSWHTHTNK